MSNQRQYQRISFRAETDIDIAGTLYRCNLQDLALRGALLCSDRELPLKPGDRVQLAIYLPDSDLHLSFAANLVHHHEDLYGFLFTGVDDQTMGHLRRLLELNLGDAEEIEREFLHWLRQPSDL